MMQPAEEMRLVSMKTPGQQLQEGSSLAELGVENDEEVAVAYHQNGETGLLCSGLALSQLDVVMRATRGLKRRGLSRRKANGYPASLSWGQTMMGGAKCCVVGLPCKKEERE